MDIKIPSGLGQGDGIEAIKDGAEAIDGQEKVSDGGEIAPVGQDAVAKIASQVAEGTITRGEAVDKLLAHAMGSPAVQSVPDDVKQEIEDVLQAMLETDPHLKSLVAGLGPDEEP